MSRIANNPIEIPNGVQVNLDGRNLSVKGAKGKLELVLHDEVELNQEDNQLTFAAKGNGKTAVAMSGTTRSLVNNMVVGVSEGFEKKLQLNGVGYRAKASGKTLNLTLGFSHPIDPLNPLTATADTVVVIVHLDGSQIGRAHV